MTGLRSELMTVAEDGLLQAELRSVLDAIPAGVLLLSPAGRIRFTNAKFAQLFGLDFRTLSEIEDYQSLVVILRDAFSRRAGVLLSLAG